MSKPESIISLDPIDRKKRKGLIGRIMITRWSGGRKIRKMPKYGHYMFCGEQGSGKTASALWFAEKLKKQHAKKAQDVTLYSNMGIGSSITRKTLVNEIQAFKIDETQVRIIIVDEIQTYFPKDAIDKETREIMGQLIAIFSQLRKRNTYIISTAQIYGRLHKSLREQCLYMINCRTNFNNKLINEMIPQEDILADELGRWSGNPCKIYVHGMAKTDYNTRRIIID